jgi:hypothetical protein
VFSSSTEASHTGFCETNPTAAGRLLGEQPVVPASISGARALDGSCSVLTCAAASTQETTEVPAPKGNKFAVGNKGGRPSKYRPEYAEQAEQLCRRGAMRRLGHRNAAQHHIINNVWSGSSRTRLPDQLVLFVIHTDTTGNSLLLSEFINAQLPPKPMEVVRCDLVIVAI